MNEAGEILNIEASDGKDEMADGLNVNPEASMEAKAELIEVFKKEYVLPERPEIDAQIKLILKEHQPFHFNPRRLSYSEKNEVTKKINELLEKGIIRPSDSEYASPIVLVKKKNGETRMCVDYRTLNSLLPRNNQPLPLIEDQLDLLEGKKYFSLLDLKDGFYHIRVADDSVKYTAFVTPMGQFEYLRLPFGLKPAPARFTRFVNEVLKELIEAGEVIVYMDDFMVATETLEHHMQVLKRVFRLLVKNKLELKLSKCKFLFTQIEYLGYFVSKKGIAPTKTGIEAVVNFPMPRSIRDVRGFVGLCSFFRKFVERFSIIAKPLYDLLRKDAKFVWRKKESEAFDVLKKKLTEAPVLAIYNPRDVTELHCDASSLGYGAILMQKKADLKFHPVFYFSKRTTEVESRYHSFELETLAIIYALRRFRIYLHGIPFKVVTDCNSLTLALRKKEINPRIQRWALELQSFDYTLEHREGKKMVHADSLSRATGILVIESNSLELNLSLCQNRDPTVQTLKSELEKQEHKLFELRNGLVYRKKGENLMFYVPANMENNLLFKYHDEMGHVGIEKVCELIKRNYWFPKIKEKVSTHVRNCLKCIAFSPPSGKIERQLHYDEETGVSMPFETIHIDHAGPMDSKVPKKYVFVVVDAFTKYVKLYATKTTNSREAIECLKQYFAHYSKPKVMISDRGSAFTSAEFSDFVNNFTIKHVKIATGSPQANGQAERVNRVVKAMLSKLVDNELGENWYKFLNNVEYSINNSLNKSTNETPSRLLFGVDQRGKIVDEVREFVKENGNEKERNLVEIREKAKDRTLKAQEYRKLYYNRRHKKMRRYQVGDWIMIRNFDCTAGASHKLIPLFKGPYQVIKELKNDRYVIADIEGYQVTQRPYQGVWEPANMRLWKAPAAKHAVNVSDDE